MVSTTAKKPKMSVSFALNLDEVKSEFNIRDGWEPDSLDDRYIPGLEELKESILGQGYKASKPIEVYKNGSGYVVTEGNRRLAACKMIPDYQNHKFAPELPQGHIYAVEIPQPDLQSLIVNQVSSNIAEECSPFDLGKAAAILMDEVELKDEKGDPFKGNKVAREEYVAKLLGLGTRQSVKFHISLLKADPEIKRYLLDSHNSNEPASLSPSTVMRIINEYGEEDGNTVLSIAIKDGIDKGIKQTYAKVKELAESMFPKKKPKAAKDTAPPLPFETESAITAKPVESETVTVINVESDDDFEEFVEFKEDEKPTTAEASLTPPKATQDLAKKRESSEGAIILQLAKLIKEIASDIADTIVFDGGIATIMVDGQRGEKLLELSSAVSELDLS